MSASSSSSIPPHPKQLGEFQLLDKIGEGGMGVVYRARQVSLDRIVALKILTPRLAADKNYIESFRREATAAARLQHPNMIQVFDAGEVNGTFYYAMEYVAGETLFQWVQRKSALAEKTALEIGLYVGSALKHAWERERIIHRDIKPENIIVDHEGQVKLCDLGLAKRVGENMLLGDSDEIIGTPQFMAPEQTRGDQMEDCRTDIYSLALTLYYAMTRQIPFNAPSAAEALKRNVHESLPDPRTFVPQISEATCYVLERMLTLNIADRYANWDNTLRDLELAAHGKSPQCAPLPDGKSKLQRAQNLASAQQLGRAHQANTVKLKPLKPSSEPITRPFWHQFRVHGAIIIFAILVIVACGIILKFYQPSSPPPLPSEIWAIRRPRILPSPIRAEQKRLMEIRKLMEAKTAPFDVLEQQLTEFLADYPSSFETFEAQLMLDEIRAARAAAQTEAEQQREQEREAAKLADQKKRFEEIHAFAPTNLDERGKWIRLAEKFIAGFPTSDEAATLRPLLAEAWQAQKIAKAEEERKRKEQEGAKKKMEAEAARLAEEKKQAEERTRKEAAERATAARRRAEKLFNDFSRQLLDAFSKRKYADALALAQNAVANPEMQPLKEYVIWAQDAVLRVKKFWDSLPSYVADLKGSEVALERVSGIITDAGKEEFGLQTRPDVVVGLRFQALSTADVLALAAAAKTRNADFLWDSVFFNFAEGKITEAQRLLQQAAKEGVSTGNALKFISVFSRGASESEAENLMR